MRAESQVSRSLDADAWLRIADGDETMPVPFQRFIAAWEVVVAWYRHDFPKNPQDRELLRELKSRLPELGLTANGAWEAALEKLKPLMPVGRMQGGQETDESVDFSGSDDWNGIARVLYTIRCNLLKAGKQPDDQRDLELAESGTAVAAQIARELIRSNTAIT